MKYSTHINSADELHDKSKHSYAVVKWSTVYRLPSTIYLLPSILCFLLLTACNQDFEDINTNENAPSEVQPEFLLRQVIYGYGDAMSYEGFVAGNLLSQHFAMIDFNLFDRHALSSPQEGGNPWPILYTNLRDNETILNISRENSTFSVYEGPAMVMKAYLAMTLTDLFGDVPYFEAFQGRSAGVTTPAYDSQEDIYLAQGGILDLLEQAVTVMDADAGIQPLAGDILFAGDLEGWIRFANGLRIKALMRISDRADPSAQLQEIFDEDRYISRTEHNATFDFTAGPPNSFAFATARIGIFNVFLMSETAEETYDGVLNRSIRSIAYRRSENGNAFRGVANGINPESGITPDNFARPGTIWRENTGDLDFNYLTSWEVNFLLAEAAVRGYLAADEVRLMDRGLQLSLGYWGLPGIPCQPCNWLPEDQEAAIETIITTKWAASIGNAYEGWIEWRRTGYPNLRPAEASLNNGRYPVRMPYPNDEQALNFENYQQAAAATDDNSINAKVWWDVE